MDVCNLPQRTPRHVVWRLEVLLEHDAFVQALMWRRVELEQRGVRGYGSVEQLVQTLLPSATTHALDTRHGRTHLHHIVRRVLVGLPCRHDVETARRPRTHTPREARRVLQPRAAVPVSVVLACARGLAGERLQEECPEPAADVVRETAGPEGLELEVVVAQPGRETDEGERGQHVSGVSPNVVGQRSGERLDTTSRLCEIVGHLRLGCHGGRLWCSRMVREWGGLARV